MTWHCHDCAFSAPSLPAARRHSSDPATGPVYRHGKWMRHVLTRDLPAAEGDRALTPDERTYGR